VKYTVLARIAGVVLVTATLVVMLIALSLTPDSPVNQFDMSHLIEAVPIGTKSRLEREYKLAVEFPPGFTTDTDGWERNMQTSLLLALSDDSIVDRWAASTILGQQYTVDLEPTQLVMRDFYMDTADDLLLNNAIALRLRYRFDNKNALVYHEFAPTVNQHYPFRGEIQVKVGHEETVDGFSVSNEARLEFRESAPPFSSGKTPPPAPWPIEDYMPIVKTGIYEGSVSTPGNLLSNTLIDKGFKEIINLEVALVAISTRTRFHMNMKTQYGSGPNPEQAFILSFDKTEIYEGQSYLAFLQATKKDPMYRPVPNGVFYEMEIEFERNISTNLDDAIETQNIKAANLLRDAFLKDQKTIRSVVTELFESRGIKISGMNLSKYQRGRSFLTNK
tara:strand:+ start:1568 stop:2737 length:1170 start_codon:yes stop_codon:yes gene_type:complete